MMITSGHPMTTKPHRSRLAATTAPKPADTLVADTIALVPNQVDLRKSICAADPVLGRPYSICAAESMDISHRPDK
jgi:hypothetical protein